GREESSPMKSTEAKRKQPSKDGPKAAGRSEPVRRIVKEAPRVQAEAPRPATASAASSLPMPDLGNFGVTAADAQAHVTPCEPCGRAHRHVVKNPKDVMALESFGRPLATCLAGKHAAHA